MKELNPIETSNVNDAIVPILIGIGIRVALRYTANATAHIVGRGVSLGIFTYGRAKQANLYFIEKVKLINYTA